MFFDVSLVKIHNGFIYKKDDSLLCIFNSSLVRHMTYFNKNRMKICIFL